MTEWARCNFDGKALHPDDKKLLEQFAEWLKQTKVEREIKIHIDPKDEWEIVEDESVPYMPSEIGKRKKS